ncbi:MAG: hypothetical protein ACT4OZ_17960 [Gemmatimonadota bacterium]
MRALKGFLPVIGLLTSGCGAAIPPWGPSLDAARRNADSAFEAFQLRFTNVERDDRFARARSLMGRYALVPSRLHRDKALWNSTPTPDSAVSLSVQTSWDGSKYNFRTITSPPYPRRIAEQRHLIRLRRVQGNDYEWVTVVDHAVGSATAAEIGTALNAALTSFEGVTGEALLRESRSSFASTSRTLGRLMAFDSVHTLRQPDGSTSLAMFVAFRPDSLRRLYPDFIAWVDKYIMPTNFRAELSGRAGQPYVSLRLTAGKMVIRLRARQGKLVALSGSPTPMPDSLRIRLDFSARFRIWRVGYENLVGDFIITRDAHERAFHLRFRQEPQWRLPFAVEHLIKTPLRKPFEGRGTELFLSVRDDLGPQTITIRRVRTVVNESAIMRWLGSLGAAAFGEFEGKSEIEENRFLASVFAALRADVGGLRNSE